MDVDVQNEGEGCGLWGAGLPHRMFQTNVIDYIIITIVCDLYAHITELLYKRVTHTLDCTIHVPIHSRGTEEAILLTFVHFTQHINTHIPTHTHNT